MAPLRSGGILMYRHADTGRHGSDAGAIQVYLAHPGGPYFSRKNEGYWGIPKGLLEGAEDEASAARREFEEETGFQPPKDLTDLGTVRLKSGKIVHGFAACWDRADEPPEVRSNTFRMEWPPRSGDEIEVPEVDRAGFFSPAEARRLMNGEQWQFVERLLEHLGLDTPREDADE